jgi:hypothetical protein
MVLRLKKGRLKKLLDLDLHRQFLIFFFAAKDSFDELNRLRNT